VLVLMFVCVCVEVFHSCLDYFTSCSRTYFTYLYIRPCECSRCNETFYLLRAFLVPNFASNWLRSSHLSSPAARSRSSFPPLLSHSGHCFSSWSTKIVLPQLAGRFRASHPFGLFSRASVRGLCSCASTSGHSNSRSSV
jgi:hypothetical protein